MGGQADARPAAMPDGAIVIDAQQDAAPVELPSPVVFRTPDTAAVCAATPAAPCTPGDLNWLAAEYGTVFERAEAVEVAAAGAAFRLTAFVERVGPSNIDVLVLDEEGAPMAGVPVAFYYESAPQASGPDEWYPVHVEAVTESGGRAGFALGGGAYLPACGAGGPHAIWIRQSAEAGIVPSDLADRLGMLGGTNHRHLDLIFQRTPSGAAPGGGELCPLSQ